MPLQYSLSPEMRRKLKEPLDILIRGSFKKTMREFKEIVNKEKPNCIISVGDRVSKNLVKNSVYPKLAIVDNRVMRKSIDPIPLRADKTVCVRNPPGTITSEAVAAIQEAIKSNRRFKIIVEGEEDLLTLIAVFFAPEDSVVVYGQPREGIVVVRATRKKKTEIGQILKAMENPRKAK